MDWPLATRQAIDTRFQQLRQQARKELQVQVTGKKECDEENIGKDLADAFTTILNSLDFDKSAKPVREIAELFGLQLDTVAKVPPEKRLRLLKQKIQEQIEISLKCSDGRTNEPERTKMEGHFEWLGINTPYSQLKPIFQQIILEKVKLFDNELTYLAEVEIASARKDQVSTYAHTTQELPSPGFSKTNKRGRSTALLRTMNVREKKTASLESGYTAALQSGFCDVQIRDRSEFLLAKWSSREEQEFRVKKAGMGTAGNIPVLFQFVKKYTATVKARDNIFRKWQQREQCGISPEELKYLCATSLFLNHSLAPSEKRRIKGNLRAAGHKLISKLELNIAEKIIATYRQLMQRVADLRAKYYEQLTATRKKQQQNASQSHRIQVNKHYQCAILRKYKALFQRVVEGERMRLRLDARLYRWVRMFADKLLAKIYKRKKGKAAAVFDRLATKQSEGLMRLKMRFPCSKIIKREDQYSHRLKSRTYLPSEQFTYGPVMEKTIKTANSIRLGDTERARFLLQLTGGPRQNTLSVRIDLSRKQINLSSPECIRLIVAIQAQWRCVFARKKYIQMRDEARQIQDADFKKRVASLLRLYPKHREIDLAMVQARLKLGADSRGRLRTYKREIKSPVSSYVYFGSGIINETAAVQLLRKGGRIKQFAKFIEGNQWEQLKRSGLALTSQQINENIFGGKGNALWWAVHHGNLSLAQQLLAAGADPNSSDSEFNSCLHLAAKGSEFALVFLLLDYGADATLKNNRKSCPLNYASPNLLQLLGLEVTDHRESGFHFSRREF